MQTFILPETHDITTLVNFISCMDDQMTPALKFAVEEINVNCSASNNAKNWQIVLNLYEKTFLTSRRLFIRLHLG
ncbi:MAG: hypothetical protein ACTXOO_03865 [Sodalis sp. (in: enterobacteria)]